MAKDDVTKVYVDTLTNNKYASRTSNSVEFEALKDQYMVYMNEDIQCMPDAKLIRGLALLLAHHYALDDTQPPDAGGSDKYTGPITSESVGDVSIGYGSGAGFKADVHGWKAWLAQTRWGQEYLYVMKTFKPTPLVL